MSIFQSNRETSEINRRFLDPIGGNSRRMNTFKNIDSLRPKTAQRKVGVSQMTIQQNESIQETMPIKCIESNLHNSSTQNEDFNSISHSYEIIIFKNNKFKLGNLYFTKDEIMVKQEKLMGVFIDKTTGLQNTLTSLQKDISDMFMNTVGANKEIYSTNTTFDNSKFQPMTSESRNIGSIKEDEVMVRGNVNTDYLRRKSQMPRGSIKTNDFQTKLANNLNQSSSHLRVSQEFMKDKISNRKESSILDDSINYADISRVKSKSQKIKINAGVSVKKSKNKKN